MAVEITLAIFGRDLTDKLIAGTELPVVRVLVRSGNTQRVCRIESQGRAQAKIFLLGPSATRKIVSNSYNFV